MRLRKNPIQILCAMVLALLALPHCGGDDTILTIDPVGPTIVEKGSTLQFTANKPNVSWMVEGGNGNGSISPTGLYTPPSTLPVGKPEVTVVATDSDGEVAEGVVSLRTADSIALGSPRPVNSSTLNAVGVMDFGIGFMSNHLAIGLASVHEMSVFSRDNGGMANLILAEALDFGAFAEVNLTNDPAISDFSSAIEIDSRLNPHILFARGLDAPRMMMRSSSDQGVSFGDPVPLTAEPGPDFAQIMGFMAQDEGDGLHVVFSSLNDVTLSGSILYTRSSDGGQTWSSPKEVDTSADAVIFPALAVNADGSRIYVSYFDASDERVFFSRSMDGGANFSEPTPITVALTTAIPFSKVALDPSGAVYVASADDPDGDTMVDAVLRKSTDSGTSFGGAVVINGGPTNTDDGVIVNIAIDNLGRVDAIWTSDSDGLDDNFDTLNYARSIDGGATFGEAITVATGGGSTSIVLNRALRHDESGRLYIQYLLSNTDFNAGDIFIRRGE